MPRTKKTQTTKMETATVVATQETPQIQLSPEEVKAILSAREKMAANSPTDNTTTDNSQKYGLNQLADALMQALNAVKPIEKKNIMTRKKMNPWTPKDGSPKILEFKRPMYHHGIPIEPKFTYNEVCVLLNKVKPGTYCDKLVRVSKRKDGGLDIDYPIRTAAQRLKVLPYTSGKGFLGLIERLIAERADPKKYAQSSEEDDD